MSSSQSSVGSSDSPEELALTQPNRRRQRLSSRGSNTSHEHDTQQGQRCSPDSTAKRLPVEEVESGSSRGSRGTSAEGHTWPEFLRDHTTSTLMDDALDGPRPMDQSNVERQRRLANPAHTSGRVRTISGGLYGRNESALVAQLQGSSSSAGLSQAQRYEPGTESSSRRNISESGLGAPSPIRHPSTTMRRPTSTAREVVLPKWQPDSEVSECPICSRQFTFWFRKHHCRKCGRVVCASCSPHRITIPQQFIVHPSESTGRASSTNTTSNAATSDLTGEAASSSPRPDVPPSWTGSRRTSIPVLGGGEEVRLCNPCVPDPQPSPQATMDLAEFLRQGTSRGDVRSPLERAQPSLSAQVDSHHRSLHRHYSRSDEARELRRQRGRGMIVRAI
jgi:FYVE zinc finger